MENDVRGALSKVAARTLYYFDTRDGHAIHYSLYGNIFAYSKIAGELNINFHTIYKLMLSLERLGLLNSYKAGESAFVDVTGYGITKKGLELVERHRDDEEKLLEELGDMMKIFEYNIPVSMFEELGIPLEDEIPASD